MEKISNSLLRFAVVVAFGSANLLLPGLAGDSFAQKRGGSGNSAPAAQSGGDLAERVQQLESQIMDMRVALDTMSTLPRGGASAGPMPASGGMTGNSQGNARIDVLETQVRALTAQIEQLASEVRSRSGGVASGAAPQQSPNSWQMRPQQQDGGGGSWLPQGPQPQVRGFDSRAAGSGGGGDGNRSYLQAINLYNQDDFRGARDAIKAFVDTYPSHPQIPTARFRLAQSHYKLGEYGIAAKQFWSLVRGFPKEPIAPDSFAMFAASLGQAGRTKDACEAYQQLRARYPDDAPHMPVEAKKEQSRLRC